MQIICVGCPHEEVDHLKMLEEFDEHVHYLAYLESFEQFVC